MRAPVIFSGIVVFLAVVLGGARADESRRLFDFTPISAENPVVAILDNKIQIPLSELRAYRDAERLNAITDPASLAQKRTVADDLVTEYLHVDAAYRAGVDRTAGFIRQMAATRTMILTDLIAARVEEEKKNAATPAGDATIALANQLFDAADIRISNEAYALLKTSARAIDQARPPVASIDHDPANAASPTADAAPLYEIIRRTPEAVLARYEDKSISVRQILSIYAGLPATRPKLDTTEGLLEMIKPLVVSDLMAMEAARQGLADDPAFKHKLIQNQNALLRFHAQDMIDRQVNATMSDPANELQMRAWHAQHRASYGPPREKPDQPMPTYEQVRPRVEGDYSVMLREKLLAEKAAALRQTHTVMIDDAVLEKL